jgi:hypothetical protein
MCVLHQWLTCDVWLLRMRYPCNPLSPLDCNAPTFPSLLSQMQCLHPMRFSLKFRLRALFPGDDLRHQNQDHRHRQVSWMHLCPSLRLHLRLLYLWLVSPSFHNCPPPLFAYHYLFRHHYPLHLHRTLQTFCDMFPTLYIPVNTPKKRTSDGVSSTNLNQYSQPLIGAYK